MYKKDINGAGFDPKIEDVPKLEEKIYGCPCSIEGCCSRPMVHTPEHICSGESVCEECFINECFNCDKSCSCDLQFQIEE